MVKLVYFLGTLAASGLSVFGIRAAYDQPAYRVVRRLAADVEIRAYAPRVMVETSMAGESEGEAFGRLFRYITGANQGKAMIAMTVPVEQAPQRIAMTVPVETQGGTEMMRFYLPPSVAAAGAPQPTEKGVHLVALPAVTMGVVRFSGSLTEASRAFQTARLRTVLEQAGKPASGNPLYLSYDPPFTVPFLRRNEVALQITP